MVTAYTTTIANLQKTIMKFLVLMWLAVIFLVGLSLTAASDDTNSTTETYNLINSTTLAKPGCESRCGDLIVPYPFGINSNCSIDKGFVIYCNTSLNPARAFLSDESERWIQLISDSTLRASSLVAKQCYSSTYRSYYAGRFSTGRFVNFAALPYTVSQLNKLTVIGCHDYVRLTSEMNWRRYPSSGGGCIAFCPNPGEDIRDDCAGIGCCQSPIPKEIVKDYVIDLYNLLDSDSTRADRSFNHCTYAFVGDPKEFKFYAATGLTDSNIERIENTIPIVLEWAIGSLSCAKAKATHDFSCQYSNSNCVDSTRKTGGYRCVCKQGYEGNPYLPPGCQDIDECKNGNNNPCHGNTCINRAGGYECRCLKGYKGDAYKEGGCQRLGGKFPVMIFTLALVFSLVALISGVSGTFFGIRKRKLIKLRGKFFEQNGGLFLKQKLKAPRASEAVIIYSTKELQKATENYSQERIIGQGGYGVVYKGILSDERVVAIKRSKLVDVTQAEQFINEVFILTQVIHRNVVKVLGCCLEEEVPILVYEFISNNTLFYHIHHKSGGMSWLSWENRLRVAAEVAGALGYLHSQATMPIIHRDVKSSNILLDDNYTAKISDFGASRLVPLDHDQVTTLVQGTLGYLDPEYFHTSQLTDKSDVYSFGVVLAELITGQKPLSADRTNEEKNLATYFVKAMKQNRLSEIVEPRILREGTLEQLQAVGNLVKRCLNVHGNDRPSMKEVAIELEGLKKFKTHLWDKQERHEEFGCSIVEVEQCDLYDVSSITYSTTECDSNLHSTSNASTSAQETKPR